jgi:hypothetical protein
MALLNVPHAQLLQFLRNRNAASQTAHTQAAAVPVCAPQPDAMEELEGLRVAAIGLRSRLLQTDLPHDEVQRLRTELVYTQGQRRVRMQQFRAAKFPQ